MPKVEKWVLHRLKEIDELRKQAIENYTYQSFYSELHTFCSQDLSAFYFDIRKDTLYCDDKNNNVRKSCRTVLKQVFDCLTAWLAPVLSYTAEEAWLAHIGDDNEESVHLRHFPSLSENYIDDKLKNKWDLLRKIRGVVNGALEIARQEKTIGSSLDAGISIYFENQEYINAIDDIDLEELFIVSSVKVIEEKVSIDCYKEENLEGFGVRVYKASGEKCVRCWKIREDVIKIDSDIICKRCDGVIKNI